MWTMSKPPSDAPYRDNTGTALVTTTSDHNGGASVERDKVEDLLRVNVESDSVVDLDERVGVSDGTAVVGDNVGNTTGTELHLLDLEELVGGLLCGDAVDDETALDVVKDTEVLAGLLDRDDILETSGVGGVGADLAVDLDETLGGDGVDLTTGKSVLQTVAEEDLFEVKKVERKLVFCCRRRAKSFAGSKQQSASQFSVRVIRLLVSLS